MTFSTRWPAADTASPAPAAQDPIIRFSITPTAAGAWRWETRGDDGVRQDHGVSASRKLAAAMVIRHIVRARAAQSAASPLTAKAA